VSLQFSRSMRSLRIDSYRASQIGLLLAILNVLALIVWFFMGRVTLYETSDTVYLDESQRLLAEFQPEALDRIREGQAAILRLDSGQGQPPLSIPVLVYGVDSESRQVELYVLNGDVPLDTLQGKLKGQVQVEVEHVAPVALVLRASGKFLNSQEIPVSPQQIP
jgi:hypothetical protein